VLPRRLSGAVALFAPPCRSGDPVRRFTRRISGSLSADHVLALLPEPLDPEDDSPVCASADEGYEKSDGPTPNNAAFWTYSRSPH
jgi:hypothetical protein